MVLAPHTALAPAAATWRRRLCISKPRVTLRRQSCQPRGARQLVVSRGGGQRGTSASAGGQPRRRAEGDERASWWSAEGSTQRAIVDEARRRRIWAAICCDRFCLSWVGVAPPQPHPDVEQLECPATARRDKGDDVMAHRHPHRAISHRGERLLELLTRGRLMVACHL